MRKYHYTQMVNGPFKRYGQTYKRVTNPAFVESNELQKARMMRARIVKQDDSEAKEKALKKLTMFIDSNVAEMKKAQAV